MSLQITHAFAVPFGNVRHPSPRQLNADLRALFLSREAAGQQYANPTATMRIDPGLFESRFDLFKWPEPCVRQLREFCWSQLFQMVGELNGYNAAALGGFRGHADAWFHIARKGGYFGLHNHPMASWSGVYCVDPGPQEPTQPNSGLLSFPHPNGAVAMFIDAGNAKLKSPYNFNNRDYRLDAGQLVMFPSWLRHQVLPYYGDGERITVAFNAWFTVNPPPQ